MAKFTLVLKILILINYIYYAYVFCIMLCERSSDGDSVITPPTTTGHFHISDTLSATNVVNSLIG